MITQDTFLVLYRDRDLIRYWYEDHVEDIPIMEHEGESFDLVSELSNTTSYIGDYNHLFDAQGRLVGINYPFHDLSQSVDIESSNFFKKSEFVVMEDGMLNIYFTSVSMPCDCDCYQVIGTRVYANKSRTEHLFALPLISIFHPIGIC